MNTDDMEYITRDPKIHTGLTVHLIGMALRNDLDADTMNAFTAPGAEIGALIRAAIGQGLLLSLSVHRGILGQHDEIPFDMRGSGVSTQLLMETIDVMHDMGILCIHSDADTSAGVTHDRWHRACPLGRWHR